MTIVDQVPLSDNEQRLLILGLQITTLTQRLLMSPSSPSAQAWETKLDIDNDEFLFLTQHTVSLPSLISKLTPDT